MDEPLHPSTLSEILDRTAQIYRSRFLVFLGIAALPTAVLVASGGAAVLFIQWWGSGAGPRYPVAPFLAVVFMTALALIVLPTLLCVTALATAAMSHAAARAFLGQPLGIRGSYKAVWPRGWRAVGLYVFEVVVIWVVPFAAWFVLVMLSTVLATLGSGFVGGGLFALALILAVVALVTYSFWMAIRVSLAFPAAVVEQVSAWDALRRSASLTAGTKGRILVLLLLAIALNFILSMAIAVPLSILVEMMPGANTTQHLQTTGMLLVLAVYGAGFAVRALTRPITGIALILFYYDQRIRKEAFDIEWMMLKAGLVVPLPPQPQIQSEAQPWPPLAASVPENRIAPEAGLIVPVESPAQPAGNPPAAN
jgi:hypothetical protein